MDLSGNSIVGHADLLFPVSMSYVNLSHNQFTSAGFKRFNAAYDTLEVVDLSNNNISQVAMDIFHNIPPNLHGLFLSNNVINGKLPDTFKFEKLTHFAMANNRIVGTLPDFPNNVPSLRELDLSNQKGAANGGGLSGTISMDVFKLVELNSLNLAGNSLTGEIPLSIGNLDNLKLLNLSSNMLSKEIPSELGRLIGMCLLELSTSYYVHLIFEHFLLTCLLQIKDVLEILDLSYNSLTGIIPLKLGDFVNSMIHLKNNSFDV
jgi:Leucine-rich repeat (LRR) protein